MTGMIAAVHRLNFLGFEIFNVGIFLDGKFRQVFFLGSPRDFLGF